MNTIGSQLWSLARVRSGYFALILVGVAPLLFLTARNLVRLFSEFEDPIQVTVVSIPDDPKRKARNEEADLLSHIAKRPYDPGTYPPDEIKNPKEDPEKPDLLVHVKTKLWELSRVTALAEEAKEALSIVPKLTPEELGPSHNAEKLDETLKANKKEELEPSRDKLGKLHKTLQADKKEGLACDVTPLEVRVLRRFNVVDDLICLHDADEHFRNQDYKGAMEVLELPRHALNDPAKSRPWSVELMAEAELLRRRAEYRDQAKPLLDRVNTLLKQVEDHSDDLNLPVPNEERAALRTALTAFLDKFRAPPDEQREGKAQALLRKGRQFLNDIQEIEELDAKPKTPLNERAGALHRVTRRHENANDAIGQYVRRAARKNLVGWLKNGIVERQRPAIPNKEKDVQEAEKTDGTLLIGKFEPDAGYIKHWPKSGSQGPRDYKTVHLTDLRREPGPLTPVRSVNRYNDVVRNKLLLNDETLETQGQWKTFCEDCQKLQEELDDYETKGGNKMGVSYHDVILFANKVNGMWNEDIQPILSK